MRSKNLRPSAIWSRYSKLYSTLVISLLNTSQHYSTLVMPLIDYGCCLWVMRKSSLISIQRNVLQYFLGIKRPQVGSSNGTKVGHKCCSSITTMAVPI